MKNILIVMLFLFNVSANAQTSPEVKQLLIEHGITETSICRGQGEYQRDYSYNLECKPDYVITLELANEYIEKAKLVKQLLRKNGITKLDVCSKINGAWEHVDVWKDNKYVRTTTECYPDHIITQEEVNEYIEAKRKEAKEEKEYAVAKKEKARKAAVFEKNAKIQNGKQYVCTDGYDSLVLKYNGRLFTFGGVDYITNFFLSPSIDRVKGTVTHNGNKSTCKPR